LERDLSAPVIKGVTGRHPLPDIFQASQVFARCGVDTGIQVVVYDAAGGALAAARAWWMLRWLGHTTVAVLDGGWQKWQHEGYAVRAGEEKQPSRKFHPVPNPEMILTSQDVFALIQQPEYRLLDSRSADRYRGENETIDPMAGHIPGAVSAPYADNLNPDGTMRPAQEQRKRFEKLLNSFRAEQAVFYCGSGVTAAHNVLAAEYAGLGQARLYAGSWSEWITDPTRPVTR
jgi:thiosulfate/3-mercaptopyruvate sulfurtransferase